jgi:diguanylate cyclase (GGDEF)-like protein
MRILVVDDSKAIRQIVAECVKSLGHETVFAENGVQCLEYVKQNSVDLILMDVEMPEMNGLDATRAIREFQQNDWFPIIFLTTKIDDESFSDGILAGGDAYLPKPLNPKRLQMSIIALERIYQMRQKLYRTQELLRSANKELKHLSMFDQLTGLANRRNFDQTLEKQYTLAKRTKTPVSLIICDIDYFKIYNDSYGHQQGDYCLAKVAETIGDCVSRPTDLACRYGGEEFTVILPDTKSLGARDVAEKIRLAVLAKNITHTGSKVADCVSLSLGLATYKGQFKSRDEFTKAADDALYKAKENGRNRVEVA